MANTYATPKEFANAGLALLVNNLVYGSLVDTEMVNDTFDGRGPTINLKRPPEFIIRRGRNASVQNIIQGEVAITMPDEPIGIDTAFSSVEMAANVNALLRNQELNSAMATIASEIDMQIGACTNEFHSWVGTPNTVMDSPNDFMPGPQRLVEMAVPQINVNGVLTPGDAFGIAGSLLGNAGQAGDIAKSALEKARVPVIGQVTPYMSAATPTLTTGTRTNGAVNGAAQNVAYATALTRQTYTQLLNIDGVGADATIKAGEVFTIAGVYAINPRTKAAYSYLQQFTVLADAVASGAGVMNGLSISPPIISDNTSPYQNVSAAPADNAVVTWLGAASTILRPSASFHKSAIRLVSGKLPRPYSGEYDFATDKKTGISIRYWRYSEGGSDTHNHRWDVWLKAANVDRRLGTRQSGS